MCNTWDRIRIRIWICIKTMPFHKTSCALVPLISFHIKSFLLAEERKNLFSSAIVLMDRVAKDCVHPQKMQQRQRPAQLEDPPREQLTGFTFFHIRRTSFFLTMIPPAEINLTMCTVCCVFPWGFIFFLVHTPTTFWLLLPLVRLWILTW